MSVDLAVWEGASPPTSEEACLVFDRLYERYVGADLDTGSGEPPTERMAAYVAALLDRFPDITDTDDDDGMTPWADGPLIGNASGPFIYLGMVTNDAFRAAWAHAVSTADSMGLVAFDPQSGTLANADPNATPIFVEGGAEPPTKARSMVARRWRRWRR